MINKCMRDSERYLPFTIIIDGKENIYYIDLEEEKRNRMFYYNQTEEEAENYYKSIRK